MVHDAGFMDMGRSVYQIKLTTVIEAVKDLFEVYDPIIYLSLVPFSGLGSVVFIVLLDRW